MLVLPGREAELVLLVVVVSEVVARRAAGRGWFVLETYCCCYRSPVLRKKTG